VLRSPAGPFVILAQQPNNVFSFRWFMSSFHPKRTGTFTTDSQERPENGEDIERDITESIPSYPPRTSAALITPSQAGPNILLQELSVRITGFRLIVTVVLVLGIRKAVALYKGRPVITESLDWIIGVILAILYARCLILRKQKTYVVRRLLWLGTWKDPASPGFAWFFQNDYTDHVITGVRLICELRLFRAKHTTRTVLTVHLFPQRESASQP